MQGEGLLERVAERGVTKKGVTKRGVTRRGVNNGVTRGVTGLEEAGREGHVGDGAEGAQQRVCHTALRRLRHLAGETPPETP